MLFKMCRCCQSCWEDFYWNCIEEKFCYDESIANYNPDEDDYYTKKSNGFLTTDSKPENNNSPVCIQPASNNRVQKNISHASAKIHEDDYRQIATNGPMLAPEVLSVFANSQIFHDHQQHKKAVSPSVHGKSPREADSDKLLKRLEGDVTSVTTTDAKPSIKFTFDGPSSSDGSSLYSSNQFPSIKEVDDEQDEVVLRPKPHDDQEIFRTVVNKRLRNVQSVPYFSFRPASENDIFTISGNSSNSIGQISMTPEIPSISYSALPKNYEDTPTIEKYKESVSLYSIQTANTVRNSEFDFSMPRYFGKSDIIAQSADNLVSARNSGQMRPQAKRMEKSKRLKLLRTTLPPLTIHLGKDKNKDKGIE